MAGDKGKKKAFVTVRAIVKKIEPPHAVGYILLLMRRYRDAVEYASKLLRRGLDDYTVARILRKQFLFDIKYSESAVRDAKKFAGDEELEFIKLRTPTLFIAGDASYGGNRHVKFLEKNVCEIKIPLSIESRRAKHLRARLKLKVPKRFERLFCALRNPDFPFSVRLVLDSETPLKLRLLITVPTEVYAVYVPPKTKTKPDALLLAGYDINVDRVCMVIIDQAGRIRDKKTEYFAEVNAQGTPSPVRKTIIGQKLAKLIDYAVAHGVKYHVFENLELKKISTDNPRLNRLINTFPWRWILTTAENMVKKREGALVLVDPRYTSVLGEVVGQTLGLDRHTASAYIIALKGLERLKGRRNFK